MWNTNWFLGSNILLRNAEVSLQDVIEYDVTNQNYYCTYYSKTWTVTSDNKVPLGQESCYSMLTVWTFSVEEEKWTGQPDSSTEACVQTKLGWIWPKMDYKVLHKFLESMPARVCTVIKAKRGNTKY